MPQKRTIQKWCNALRSGKYTQTRGALQDTNGYCCLGVACDMFIPKNKLELQHLTNGLFIKGADPTDQRESPRWLKEINDLFLQKNEDTKNNSEDDNMLAPELISLNDGDIMNFRSLFLLDDKETLSFDEIADMLELVFIHKILD